LEPDQLAASALASSLPSGEKAGVEECSRVAMAAAGCFAFILGSSSFSSQSIARLPSASRGWLGNSR
jgi:hypothetical protein